MIVAPLPSPARNYVADYVKAKRKVAFVHIDHSQAGYSRRMDKNSYGEMDRIFTVSDEVRTAFLSVYPEYADRVSVFHNIINWDRVRSSAQLEGGFTDDYTGMRLLTVGRLTEQKALDLSVQAMKLLKNQGIQARWYVLGEGEERANLHRLIRKLDLEQEFILLGSSDNPYPYFKQADIYVHASRHEGKSIAVQEAMYLGRQLALGVLIAPAGGSLLRHPAPSHCSAPEFPPWAAARSRAGSLAGRGRTGRECGVSIAAAPSPLRELGFPGVCADSQ